MNIRIRSVALIMASLCVASLVVGCALSPTLEPTATQVPTAVFRLVSQPFEESGENPPYRIKAEIPFLEDKHQATEQRFNQLVNSLVQGNIDSFRSSVLEDAPNPPVSVGSTFDLKYNLLSPEGKIISLKFDITSYFDGAAHPGEKIFTFNFDLASGQQLNLEQLFVPGSDYLSRIAAYCKAQLSQRDIDYTEQGADPTAENYLNWNITAEGLLITFDVYQVAAGAAGPQTVLIPYAELGDLFSDQGPLAGYGK